MTNFEKIVTPLRTARGLADFMIEHSIDDIARYCKELPECNTWMETDDGVPGEHCQKCLEEWLRQEVTDGVE